MSIRKTEKMLEVEAFLKKDFGPEATLETVLPQLLAVNEQQATAEMLGISRATLKNWLPRLGLERQVTYAAPARAHD